METSRNERLALENKCFVISTGFFPSGEAGFEPFDVKDHRGLALC